MGKMERDLEEFKRLDKQCTECYNKYKDIRDVVKRRSLKHNKKILSGRTVRLSAVISSIGSKNDTSPLIKMHFILHSDIDDRLLYPLPLTGATTPKWRTGLFYSKAGYLRMNYITEFDHKKISVVADTITEIEDEMILYGLKTMREMNIYTELEGHERFFGMGNEKTDKIFKAAIEYIKNTNAMLKPRVI